MQRWSFGSKFAVYSGLLAYGVTDFALLSGQRPAFDGKGLEVKGYICLKTNVMCPPVEVPKGARAGREKFLLDITAIVGLQQL